VGDDPPLGSALRGRWGGKAGFLCQPYESNFRFDRTGASPSLRPSTRSGRATRCIGTLWVVGRGSERFQATERDFRLSFVRPPSHVSNGRFSSDC